MKILTNKQVKSLDEQTILIQGISSEALMERAGTVFTNWFCHHFSDINRPVCIYCGPGNNGGDGLVIGRLLIQKLYRVRFVICHISSSKSADFQINLSKLNRLSDYKIDNCYPDQVPILPKEEELVIDAILGSGLNKPLSSYWLKVISLINTHASTIIAVDMPSGLFADDHTTQLAIQAQHTMAFQIPKLAFFFQENQKYVGNWILGHIGLEESFLATLSCSATTLDLDNLAALIKKRNIFDHKGTYGHALVVAGSFGKAGAAVLAAKGALRAGAGLVTALTAGSVVSIIQQAVSEVMCLNVPSHEEVISSLHQNLSGFDAIGIGPGLGIHDNTAKALEHCLISYHQIPMVLDADALNLIARHRLHGLIPRKSILTPHPKEFERLFGVTLNDFERFELLRVKAQEHECVIVLKGAFSCIALPDGSVHFNMSGNPGMATAGSGDVLTGILTGLLVQGYSAGDAAKLGVFLHGSAGDLAVQEISQEALIASDITQFLGKAYLNLLQYAQTKSGRFYRRWNF